jgi:hypothetical protein
LFEGGSLKRGFLAGAGLYFAVIGSWRRFDLVFCGVKLPRASRGIKAYFPLFTLDRHPPAAVSRFVFVRGRFP